MSDNDHNAGPLPHEVAEAKEEERRAAEREELLNARRARQTGSSRGGNVKLLATLGFIAASFFVFVMSAGPGKILGLLGIGGGDNQRTSQIDMQVDREKEANSHLDFLVPAIPEPPRSEVDPNAAFNEKFKALQEKLAEMERNRQPGLSSGEVQRMLSGYNDAMTKRLEEERKAMADENARLRSEAQKAEEERRKAEDAAKLREEQYKLGREIEMKQRESKAVIVDDSGRGKIADAAAGGDAFSQDLDQNERFLKASAGGGWQTSVSKRLSDPSRTVVQGSIIAAVLETAIDTQLPGSIRAQVTRPVYSFDGSRVLMAPGTILIGQFNNDVDIAQKRVLIAWNRAITPDGKSIALGSIGTDRLGRSGSLGNVDNRYGTKFGAAMLVSAITAVPTILSEQLGKSSKSSGTTINIGSSGGGGSSGGTGAGAQLANSMGGDLSDQASGVLEKYLTLPPVIRIPQGEEIRVFVNRDLIFR